MPRLNTAVLDDPLEDSDWEIILSSPWKSHAQEVLEFFRRNENAPTPLSVLQ